VQGGVEIFKGPKNRSKSKYKIAICLFDFLKNVMRPHHPDRTNTRRGGVSITVKLCEVGKPILL